MCSQPKIWFVDPPFDYPSKFNAASPNLGILSIAALLTDCEVKYFPLQLFNSIAGRSAAEQYFDDAINSETSGPDILALSCITSSLAGGLDIAHHVKEISRSTVTVFGGIASTLQSARLVDNPVVDYVIEGSGESAMRELISSNARAKGGTNSQGRIIRGKKREPMIPHPEYSIGHLAEFNAAEIRTPVEFSRGCPYRCNFCYLRDFPRSCQAKPADQIEQELVELRTTYGVHNVIVADDTFGLDTRRTAELLPILRDSGLDFLVETRPEVLVSANLSEWRTAGISEIIVGLESPNPEIIASMEKPARTSERRSWANLVMLGIENCVDADITIHPIFMLGWPGETSASLAQTLEYARSMYGHSRVLPFVSFPTPHPGSELETRAKSLGLCALTSNYEKYIHILPVAVPNSLGNKIDALKKLIEIHNIIRIESGGAHRNPTLAVEEVLDYCDLI